jgi:hypothetical protein
MASISLWDQQKAPYSYVQLHISARGGDVQPAYIGHLLRAGRGIVFNVPAIISRISFVIHSRFYLIIKAIQGFSFIPNHIVRLVFSQGHRHKIFIRLKNI